MTEPENAVAKVLMDYGVLKNADADRMAKRIAGMFEKERDELRTELDKLRCAYGNVCDNAAITEKERAQLAAKCAEMREKLHEAFAACWTNDDVEDGNYYVPSVIMLDLKQLAMSDSCGKGWLSPEKAGRLREGLDKLLVHAIEFYNDWKKGDFALCELAECDMESMAEQFNRAKQALEETK